MCCVDFRGILLCVLGCKTEWDEIHCWLRADVGQVVNVSCLEVFQHFSSKQGQRMKNCSGLFCIKVMYSKCTAERNPFLDFFGLFFNSGNVVILRILSCNDTKTYFTLACLQYGPLAYWRSDKVGHRCFSSLINTHYPCL